MTITPRRRLSTSATFVIISGAIAAAAIALSPAAQADAQSDAFAQSCTDNPGAYVSGAVRGVYRAEVVPGSELLQICSLYGPPKYVVVLGRPVELADSAKHLGDYTRVVSYQNQPGVPYPEVQH